MQNPRNLAREELAAIVSAVQDRLYLDLIDHKEVYSPDKEWEAAEITSVIVSLLGRHRLTPSRLGDEPEPAVEAMPRARQYVLYDFDTDELASTTVYRDRSEAVEDAAQFNNVIVVAIVLDGKTSTATGPSGPDSHCYDLAIDGPTFRAQRELLQEHLAEEMPQGVQPAVARDPRRGELLEGLINLMDEIADQAFDRYGIDCLLRGD
jgi:hypothetical protein